MKSKLVKPKTNLEKQHVKLEDHSKGVKEIINSWPKWKQGILISTVHELPNTAK